jgi:hypothetical protein
MSDLLAWGVLAGLFVGLQTANAAETAGASLQVDGPQALSALQAVNLSGSSPPGAQIELRDGTGRAYARQAVTGAFAVKITCGCALGRQSAVLLSAGGVELANATFTVDAASDVQCNAGGYDELWRRLVEGVGRGRTREMDGRQVHMYETWVRDDTHVLKANKYWEPEVGSFEEHMLDIQTPDGIIYDYVVRPDVVFEQRLNGFEPRFSRIEEGKDYGYQRMPTEADLEYLLVEGIYQAWQARGDNEWMARQLPRLDKAIQYAMTDPLRWDPSHGLVMRAYTIDTWDFKYCGLDLSKLKDDQINEAYFNVHPGTPMCIMHGDNSGMYQACLQMSIMYGALGNKGKHADYEGMAENFRANTNHWCWNGRYYDHWVPVTPLPYDLGVDGTKVLSLSNPYDINRGLPDQAQAASIIREYMRIREETKDSYMAEWFSIYPWFPKPYSGTPPATYVNGGIITIVAGELAKAAFNHGFEDYGVDILGRVHALLRPQNEDAAAAGARRRRSPLPCTFRPDGTVDSGIPDAWGQAAVLSAIMEGLCGLRDNATVFRSAAVEPRWAATQATEATAIARYGASQGYVAYRFSNEPAAGRIVMTLTGSGEEFSVHVLLPHGAAATGVEFQGRPVEFSPTTIEGSAYAEFVLSGPMCGSAVVRYAAAR